MINYPTNITELPYCPNTILLYKLQPGTLFFFIFEEDNVPKFTPMVLTNEKTIVQLNNGMIFDNADGEYDYAPVSIIYTC